MTIVALPPRPQLTDAEWRRLPRAEKDRLRALKHERRRLEKQNGGESAAIQVTPVESSPFIHAATKQPLDLSFIGGGGPCFIVLSGPSSKKLDLSQLSKRGIYTIAVNNAGTICRPNAWTCVDPVSKFHDSIWLDPGVLKFCPSTMLKRGIRRKRDDGSFESINISDRHMTPADCPNVAGYLRRPNFNVDTYLSEPFINWGVSKGYARKEKKRGRERQRILNVMFAVLKIAYSIGFRHVFLVGCDFHMDAAQPYAFEQGKHIGGANGNNNAYRIMQSMFTELLPHFAAAGFNVYNVNSDSGLTVFPFVDYIDAINGATIGIQQNPDPKDWYFK